MKKPRKKPAKPGAKREAFRNTIAERLYGIGFRQSQFGWKDRGTLYVVMGDEAREFPMACNMARSSVAYQLGRIDMAAEMLGKIRPQPAPIALPWQVPAQLDLVTLAQQGA
jgi:hypothetical protein